MTATGDGPGPAVLAAFGIPADDAPVRLPGGRGLAWRAGDVVLRPHGDLPETLWKADVLAHLEHTAGFRTARPVPSSLGGWTLDGWEAWRRVAGEPDESRLLEVVRAGAAFHGALAHLPRPDFLDLADDPWCQGDRMAWQEQPLPASPALDRLAAAFLPVDAPSQVIHGDLLGNVLFTPGQAPAIIDWAPYWRPAGLGAAIAAVDAACWHGFPTDALLQVGAGTPQWGQLLLRALTFRVATWHLLDRWDEPMAAHHEPVITAVLEFATN